VLLGTLPKREGDRDDIVMDPISLTATGKSRKICMKVLQLTLSSTAVGFVSTAASLAQSCFQLYQFWESLQEAPAAVQVIKNDLMLLNKVLQDISNEVHLSPAVALTLNACQAKVEVSRAVLIPRHLIVRSQH